MFSALAFLCKGTDNILSRGKEDFLFEEDTRPATEGQMIQASADLNLKSFRTSHSSGS